MGSELLPSFRTALSHKVISRTFISLTSLGIEAPHLPRTKGGCFTAWYDTDNAFLWAKLSMAHCLLNR